MVKKPKKPQKKIWKIILISILGVFLFSGVAFSGVLLAMIKTAPDLNVNQILTLSETSTLYDDKDQFMDIVITSQQRTVVSSKDIPQNLKNAFVSIEDERFYKHMGIDLRRITGSVYINIVNKFKGQSGLHGGSTITQQLLKNTLLTPEVSLKRKVQEMYLAIKLEKHLSKDQILEAYMNTIFLGGKAMGIEAASNQYFSKSVKELNLIECAYLAGVPQSPSVYYPFSPSSKKDPSVYLNRTKSVLNKMYENKYITKEQHAAAINDLNNKKLVFQPQSNSASKLNYEWFSLPAIEQVKKDLKNQYHYSDEEVERVLLYGGIKIYTTMDKGMQEGAARILNDTNLIPILSKKNNIVQPQASAVIMDYKTGQVKTIIGGRGEQPPLSYNRAASDKYLRPPGSSIKPLTVYGAAIDSNLATAATVVDDSPLAEDIGRQYGSSSKPYNPRNDDGTYRGLTTIRNAITQSVNVIAVKLEHQIGLKTGITYGEKFGLNLTNNDRTSISALALGQLTQGTNPLTMAAAYGTFGNSGTYTYPKLYRKVVDRTGKTILDPTLNTKKILQPESAYIMYDLLKGPVSGNGTGPSANFGSMPVRGKTGTSGDSRDLWFCGLTPYYSASVWIGNDDNSSLEGALNSNRAANVWGRLMELSHKNLSPKDIPQPPGIVTADVCMDSGKLATDLCRRDSRGSRIFTEIFTEGSVPSESCDVHLEAKINKLTGKLASQYTPSFLTESKVFLKKGSGNKANEIPSDVDDSKPKEPNNTNSNTKPNENPKPNTDSTVTEPKPNPKPNTSPENNSN